MFDCLTGLWKFNADEMDIEMVMNMGFIAANSTCMYQAAGDHNRGIRTTCVSRRLEVSDRDLRRLLVVLLRAYPMRFAGLLRHSIN
jgi:hypothetical protein